VRRAFDLAKARGGGKKAKGREALDLASEEKQKKNKKEKREKQEREWKGEGELPVEK
jgi:hypothetical protein